MSDGMGREFTYLSSHATNRYFIPNWGKKLPGIGVYAGQNIWGSRYLGKYIFRIRG